MADGEERGRACLGRLEQGKEGARGGRSRGSQGGGAPGGGRSARLPEQGEDGHAARRLEQGEEAPPRG